MARPHGKSLIGKEGGKAAQHWYDWLSSKKRLQYGGGKWNGARSTTKPGVRWVIWQGFPEFQKKP